MATTTQTIAAPSYLQPAIQTGAQFVQDIASRPYTPYSAPRVAGLSPLETQSFNTAANYQPIPEFGMASGAYQSGIAGLQTPSYTAGQMTPSYKANQTTGGVFDSSVANQYMTPYQQGVTDIAKREADTAFQKQQAQLRARMASAGAFGGSRATLLETENQRGQNQLLNDIQTKGLQDAFGNAQQQFERDRTARLSAFSQNEGARQNQSQLETDIFRANEAARQQQGSQSINSSQLALQGAQGLAGLGTSIDASERARLDQLSSLGLQQRQQQQAGLDAQYQQFLDERDYPLRLADMLTTGVARLQGNNRVSTTDTPDPSTFEQFLGGASGITGLLGTLGGSGGVSGGVDFLKGLLPDDILGSIKGFFKL